jgi:hypothetical protein
MSPEADVATIATRMDAPPSSGEVCIGDVAGAAAPPRSPARLTDEALKSIGAVATSRSTVPGATETVGADATGVVSPPTPPTIALVATDEDA